jgi:hypothetical protein
LRKSVQTEKRGTNFLFRFKISLKLVAILPTLSYKLLLIKISLVLLLLQSLHELFRFVLESSSRFRVCSSLFFQLGRPQG